MNAGIGFGATINGLHTYKDFGLVIGNTDVVGSPAVKTTIIDVPGSSNRIDLTEALTGKPEYESRTLKMELGCLHPISEWANRFSDFMNMYHGKKVQVILDSEPDYCYEGRAEVSGLSRNRTLGTFTMTIDCDAYKHDISDSLGNWLWDSFNFETGEIRDYSAIEVSGSKNMLIHGSKMPVVPVFHVSELSASATNYIRFNSVRYNIVEGRNRFAGLVIPVEGGRVYFYGTYKVDIEFRGGSL